MNAVPGELPISVSDAAVIATEVWRLTKLIETNANDGDAASIRYSLREFNRVLNNLEIVTSDLTGRPYEPGRIEHVVDVVEDAGLPAGQQFIEEMVCLPYFGNELLSNLARSPFGEPLSKLREEQAFEYRNRVWD